MALTKGELEPLTEKQKHFILVVQNKEKSIYAYEDIWFRYINRKRIEREQGDKFKIKYELKGNSFYSCKDAKKLRGMMFGEMNKQHSE